MEIRRDKYLERFIVRKHNGMIKVIAGIRRYGKSYLLNNLFYNHLISSGISYDHIIRFAFDSADDLSLIGEDIIEIQITNRKVDSFKFMKYIVSKVTDSNMYYLLLDEVQQLGNFEAVLNSYLKKENFDVYVTGSNSKFLSSDIVTEFRGRGDIVHIMPLSFSEFYSAYNGSVDKALEEYLIYGGLPPVCLMNTVEQKINYLNFQLKNVYLKDVVSRNKLKNYECIEEILDICASNITTLVNPLKISNTFKSVKKTSISPNTVSSYIRFLEEAFLIKKVIRYDIKRKKYINTPFKIYFEDLGLRNSRLNFRQIEYTHIMENIIYNELRYRGYNVDVGVVNSIENIKGFGRVRQNYEIDFVANLGSKKYYIQSAYEIDSEGKKVQETKSYDKINDSFKKIIVVFRNVIPRRNEKGYLIIGIEDFLLNENSLDF